VARLAGLPEAVVERARAVLRDLEAAEDTHSPAGAKRLEDDAQLALALGSADSRLEMRRRQVLEELSKIDPETTTPLEALTALGRWREHLEDG
jgi:DNA mismatch repair protein MutS